MESKTKYISYEWTLRPLKVEKWPPQNWLTKKVAPKTYWLEMWPPTLSDCIGVRPPIITAGEGKLQYLLPRKVTSNTAKKDDLQYGTVPTAKKDDLLYLLPRKMTSNTYCQER